MVDLSKLPNSPYASWIDEAMILVQRCAKRRLAGDLTKGAIRRVSQRFERPFVRIREIWYGDARRIDGAEMDRLQDAEIARAVAAMEFLSEKLLLSPSSASYPAIRHAGEALLAAAAMLSATSRRQAHGEAKTTQE
jgi:hypothetical protein